MEAQSLSYWTAREFSLIWYFINQHLLGVSVTAQQATLENSGLKQQTILFAHYSVGRPSERGSFGSSSGVSWDHSCGCRYPADGLELDGLRWPHSQVWSWGQLSDMPHITAVCLQHASLDFSPLWSRVPPVAQKEQILVSECFSNLCLHHIC